MLRLCVFIIFVLLLRLLMSGARRTPQQQHTLRSVAASTFTAGATYKQTNWHEYWYSTTALLNVGGGATDWAAVAGFLLCALCNNSSCIHVCIMSLVFVLLLFFCHITHNLHVLRIWKGLRWLLCGLPSIHSYSHIHIFVQQTHINEAIKNGFVVCSIFKLLWSLLLWCMLKGSGKYLTMKNWYETASAASSMNNIARHLF